MNKIFIVVMSLYLGLAPVYWYPGISPSKLAMFKLSLILTATSLIWFDRFRQNDLKFPKGMLGPIGFVLLVLSASGGLLQAELSISLLRMKDILLSFIMLWTFYIYASKYKDFQKVFVAASLIISFHCMLVVSSRYLGFPIWSGPKEYVASELWMSGFGSLRTGWSSGTSLFVGILASGFILAKHWYLKLILAASFSTIIMSQVVVGGRAGILASLICLIGVFIYNKKILYIVIFSIVGVIFVFQNMDYIIVHLRFDRLESGVDAGALDNFSAGRLESNLVALRLAFEKPIFGHGFGSVTFSGTEIHNLWLRIFVEAGMFMPLIFASIVLNILLRCKENINTSSAENKKLYVGFFIILTSGLVITMLEPRFIMGTFQISALWWAIAGIVIAKIHKNNDQSNNIDNVGPVKLNKRVPSRRYVRLKK